MTHLEGRIIWDTLLGIAVLFIIDIVFRAAQRDWINRKSRWDFYEKVKDLPKTKYEKYSYLDKAIMHFLPTRELIRPWERDDRLNIFLNTDVKLSAVYYKVYKQHFVVVGFEE